MTAFSGGSLVFKSSIGGDSAVFDAVQSWQEIASGVFYIEDRERRLTVTTKHPEAWSDWLRAHYRPTGVISWPATQAHVDPKERTPAYREPGVVAVHRPKPPHRGAGGLMGTLGAFTGIAILWLVTCVTYHFDGVAFLTYGQRTVQVSVTSADVAQLNAGAQSAIRHHCQPPFLWRAITNDPRSVRVIWDDADPAHTPYPIGESIISCKDGHEISTRMY